MDVKNMGVLAHCYCFCAQHLVWSVRGVYGARHRIGHCHCSTDHRLCPCPGASSASELAACFCSHLSFRELYTPEALLPRRGLLGNRVNKASSFKVATIGNECVL